jgi:type II secretory pathway predicted ATPase ExeA
MYEQFFGFSKKPFNITPDPEFLFMTESHQEALASLVYGIQERRGFISISGEVGTGKTTLLNYLRKILDERVKSIFIFQTHISFEDLLREILQELNLPEGDGNKFSMTRQLRGYLLKALERKENLAILIDEAQNLSEEVLEELRMLSNLETGEGKLFQMVLVGQPELEKKLNSAGLRQLKQRIGIRRKIRALSEEESRQYIEQRLRQLGSSSDDIFTPEALGLICRYGEGIFRNINILCDNAFLIGYGLKKKKIDVSIVNEVLEDMGIAVSRAPFQSKKVYSPEAAIDSHYRYQEPSKVHKLDSDKEYQPESWWTAPRLSGIVAIGLIAFLAWLFFFNREQLPASNSVGSWLMHKARSIDVMSEKKIESPKKGSTHPVRGTKTTPNSKITGRNELRSGGQLLEVSEATKRTGEEDGKRPVLEPSRGIRGAGSKKMIEVPEGENLYSLIDQYYSRPNPTIVDCVLENNPTIENMHQLQIRQKIVIPEIDEDSLLMRSLDGIWRVHLGTFPTPDMARIYEEEPSLRGKEIVTVERRVSPRDTWYRVIAERFDSREEGLKVIQELKRRRMLPALRGN